MQFDGRTRTGDQMSADPEADEYAPLGDAHDAILAMFGDGLRSYTLEDPVGLKSRIHLSGGLTVTFVMGFDYLDDAELADYGPGAVGWSLWDSVEDDSFTGWAWGDARTGAEAAQAALGAMISHGMAEATGGIPPYRCTYVARNPDEGDEPTVGTLKPVRIRFGAPDGPTWDAYSDGTYWNGFANVWVRRDTMTAILAWLDRVEPGAVDLDERDAEVEERTDQATGLVNLSGGWAAEIVGGANNG